MADNQIELKSVGELLGMKFLIPSYQRGYRWTEQQVKDLLNDIEEFRNKFNNKNNDNEANTFSEDYYCLQPLVVKETVNVDKFKEQLFSKIENQELLNNTRKAISDNTKWEVIDGQQRLTTMYILLSYLNNVLNNDDNNNRDLYDISYQTRVPFKGFYGEITKDTQVYTDKDDEEFKQEKFKQYVINKFEKIVKNNKGYDNIDFFHILQTLETIKKWLDDNEIEKEDYKLTILNRVKFIWYESVDEDPIRVFTRLNIGKIKLTNAELIKALFLNRSNFNAEGDKHLKLRQQEIASEWDNIEYTLQNDEFWLFLHAPNYDKPTRIDFIFDLICEQDSLKIFRKTDNEDEIDKKAMDKTIGTDEYRIFRYFYEYFKSVKAENSNKKTKIEICWEEVKKYFQTFLEWFNDLELYHYVGYLIEQEEEKEKNKKNDEKKLNLIKNLFTDWDLYKTKEKFVSKLKVYIKERIKDSKDLNKQYEIDGGPKKTTCRPLLLLHNIQTIINQNKDFTSKKGYKLPVFYKFPFHLFKKEKWNVEHIDSNTENTLEDETDKLNWLKSSWFFINEEVIKNEILDFVNKNSNEFSELHEKIIKRFEISDPLNNNEKNQIGNFTLLDEHTNKSYQNSIFPMKKIILLGKDQGITYTIKDDIDDNDKIIGFKLSPEIKQLGGNTAFVPPVTKMCFLKAYNPLSNNPYSWDKKDAEAYRQNILETLKDFGVTDSSNN